MTRETITGYELLEPIGRGAGSTIFRAVNTSTGDVCAIKQIVAETSESSKYLRHIENEYRNLTVLRDQADGYEGADRVVGTYDLIKSGLLRKRKVYSMVMEFVDGADLRRERRYPTGQVIDFLLQVAEALAFVHRCNLVHADLKPENIMVSPQGTITIIDFGFSCPLGSEARTIRGTREYMAPEQVDRGHIDARTDLYNMGASFYYLLTNQQVPSLMPGPEGSGLALVSRDIRPTPLWELNPRVPVRVAQIIMSCVELDPERRPPSAAQVCKDLKPLVEALYRDQDTASEA
jgi:serine/threonine-protein kinase